MNSGFSKSHRENGVGVINELLRIWEKQELDSLVLDENNKEKS